MVKRTLKKNEIFCTLFSETLHVYTAQAMEALKTFSI